MELSPEDRSSLAEELWDSMRTAEERAIDEAWYNEVEGRLFEVDAGIGELIAGEDVIRELRAKYDSAPKIETAWLDEVDRRIALQDAGAINDIDAEDLYRELRKR